MSRVDWKLVSGTPNYVSADGRFVAVYQRTVRGFGLFYVFPAELPKRARSSRSALAVGGLPNVLTVAM